MASSETIRTLFLDGRDIALDAEGYLINLDDWSPALARQLAAEEGRTLTPEHWEVIEVLRYFYQRFSLSPAMRPLTKAMTQRFGADKGRSLHLMRLFPDSPPKVGARIAGLPKPTNCL